MNLNRFELSEFININRGDVAPLVEGYCGLIIRASQFSSTTRNLVPRFKRLSKGKDVVTKILSSLLGLGCFSRRGRSTRMKLSSFLWGLHCAYERIKGEHSGRTDLGKVEYLVDNIGEGGGK